MTAKCSSCEAPIIWTVTESGKRMPVDATPAGKVTVLVRDPAGGDTPISKQRDHYVSHFATCPQADRHRKKTHTAEQVSVDKE
jgi:hypothetical protein